MRIAIVGYGEQGKSAFDYWSSSENEITICDTNSITVPDGAKTAFGADYLNNLHEYDLIVRSPSVHPRDIIDCNTDHPEVMKRVTTVTNEFMRVCPTRNIIGVTGTKGKGTTSSLIANILETSGYTVHLGGNIGIPPLTLLKENIQPDDWVVLELANFQLIDLKISPPIAVCLMIAPEHLDWHSDMYEYMQAKKQLFVHQAPEGTAVFNARNLFSEEITDASPAHKLSYDVPPIGDEPYSKTGAFVEGKHIHVKHQKICHIDDVALLGRHNLENVCAAIAACWPIIGLQSNAQENITRAVQNFGGLPHRLDIVKEIAGVWYVDDSFGTTPETAIVALQAFLQPKVLIVGGSDKGADFNELAKAIAHSNTHHVVAIGVTGPKIVELVQKHDVTSRVSCQVLDGDVQMPEIVNAARKVANEGDVVLLSTGCASFGMFKNYKDRGEQFTAAVQALGSTAK